MNAAVELTNPAQKLLVLDMAAAWLRLTDKAEKSRGPDSAYVTPDVLASELPHPPPTG